jgi:cytochrome c-type protein NapB
MHFSLECEVILNNMDRRLIMIKRNLVLVSVMVTLLLVSGCAVAQTSSEEEIGLRKTSLYSEDKTIGDAANYSKAAPGESKLIPRSFENAPPMISHDVEGMLPITRDYNACLDCHVPEIAAAVNATAIPPSHFASFRPVVQNVGDQLKYDGKAIDNTSDVISVVHQREGLSGERYMCSSCHAPQSQNAPLVENSFSPEFRSKDGITSSNLLDTLNEGL